MRIALLSANLGNFDVNAKDPVKQDLPEGVSEITFHRFTDEDFPPIAGLTPRLQYRIPKLFGWQMFPGYDIYIWFDSSCSLQRADCVKWFLDQLGDNDMAFFRHPWRSTIKQEVDHIEEKLKLDHWYITPRYKNGLHKEFLEFIKQDEDFIDENLYASTAFIYKNNNASQITMANWWSLQSRYFTCDQIHLPYAMFLTLGLKVKKILDNLFKIGYLSLVSHHR